MENFVHVAFLSSLFLVTPSASENCFDIPPGSALMSRGVDITRLDLTPLEMTQFHGFRQSVVHFTCNEKRKVKRAGKTYDVPDQVHLITSTPGDPLSPRVNLYKSHNDVRESMKEQVGGHGPQWNLAFANSLTYKQVQHAIIENERLITHTSSFDPVYTADLQHYWTLKMDPEAERYFSEFVKDKSYVDDPTVYHRFIEISGTHYFQSATFGGYICHKFETEMSQLKEHTDMFLKQEAKDKFLESVRKLKKKAKEIGEVFQLYGGVSIEDDLETWRPTLNNNPWLFTCKLEPISLLLRNSTHRSGLEIATEQHILKSYLNELDRLLGTIVHKMKNELAVGGLRNKLKEISNVALGKLNKTEIETLGQAVNAQFDIPDWFLHSVSLVFRWKPSEDALQCGRSQINNTVQALPNHKTPSFLDDTDDRHGGCYYQWKIAADTNAVAKWFLHEVELCFSFYGNDVEEQCNSAKGKKNSVSEGENQNSPEEGKRSGSIAANWVKSNANRKNTEYCAFVNKFTKKYLDDTDDRRGGCVMKWKLKVSSAAPYWAHNIKLCLFFYPTGDRAQCGEGEKRCAKSNEWTDDYFDDTDDREGGCKLKWGLFTPPF